jgi:hypothetical protein
MQVAANMLQKLLDASHADGSIFEVFLKIN